MTSDEDGDENIAPPFRKRPEGEREEKVRREICGQLNVFFPEYQILDSYFYIHSDSINLLCELINKETLSITKINKEVKSEFDISRKGIADTIVRLAKEVERLVRFNLCMEQFCEHAVDLHPKTNFSADIAPDLRKSFKESIGDSFELGYAEYFISCNYNFSIPEEELLVVRYWLSALGTQTQIDAFEMIFKSPLVKYNSESGSIYEPECEIDVKEEIDVNLSTFSNERNHLYKSTAFLYILSSAIRTKGSPKGEVRVMRPPISKKKKIGRFGTRTKGCRYQLEDYLHDHSEEIYCYVEGRLIDPTDAMWAGEVHALFIRKYPDVNSGNMQSIGRIVNYLGSCERVLSPHKPGQPWAIRFIPKK